MSKNKIEEIPCKNCVTLAICKSKLCSSSCNPDDEEHKKICKLIEIICHKCSILNDYVRGKGDKSNHTRREYIRLRHVINFLSEKSYKISPTVSDNELLSYYITFSCISTSPYNDLAGGLKLYRKIKKKKSNDNSK
jgi:hypothetical protein